MKTFIAGNVGAIGYSAFNYIDKTVKPLSIDGVSADTETVANGTYTLKRELILYTREDASESTAKFIEYLKKNAFRYTGKSGVFPVN
jgi:phosphate transport system substrate-binding protein